MIDTHCHLTEPVFRDQMDAVVARAAAAGISDLVVPSVDRDDLLEALRLARGRDAIHVAGGIHPMWADFRDGDECRAAVVRLTELVETNRADIVAIGEIGLDSEPGMDAGTVPNLTIRMMAFRMQMELARDFNLPVIIHSRGMMAELVETLEFFGPAKAGGVLHAFSGSPETMRRLRGLGYLRGVAGTVTRPEAVKLAAAIRESGVANLVLETDAPFIANAIHRRGEVVPQDLGLTAGAVAALTGTQLNEVIRITDENARRTFGI